MNETEASKLSKIYSKSGGARTSALLFLIVFGIWQAYDLIMVSFSLQTFSIHLIYFATHGATLAIFILFVKLGESDLKTYGLRGPSKLGRSVLLSISLVMFYIFATLMPGLLFGIRYKPPLGILAIFFNITRAILISLTKETIFRGYIFKNLLNKHGFFTALYTSSIMFGLSRYDEPVSIVNLITMTQNMSISEIVGDVLFMEVMPAFIGGLFLGYMFYKMDWSLLGPVIFNMGILLYSTLSPITVGIPWWMGLTFEVIAYVCLFVFIDSAIQEPSYRRKRYGLES